MSASPSIPGGSEGKGGLILLGGGLETGWARVHPALEAERLQERRPLLQRRHEEAPCWEGREDPGRGSSLRRLRGAGCLGPGPSPQLPTAPPVAVSAPWGQGPAPRCRARQVGQRGHLPGARVSSKDKGTGENTERPVRCLVSSGPWDRWACHRTSHEAKMLIN